MPSKARRKKGATSTRRRATSRARATSRQRSHRKRSVSNPRVIVMRPNRKNSHRSHKSRRNPHFFGTMASPMKLMEYIAGGLLGVTINRAVLPMLPASVTSNNIFAVGAAVAIAVAEWWVFSFVSKDFGSAVGFGALMNAGNQALNAFLPSFGMSAAPGLSGRGVGDLVPSNPALPFWPSASFPGTAAAPYMGGVSAYPRPYGMAA